MRTQIEKVLDAFDNYKKTGGEYGLDMKSATNAILAISSGPKHHGEAQRWADVATELYEALIAHQRALAFDVKDRMWGRIHNEAVAKIKKAKKLYRESKGEL